MHESCWDFAAQFPPIYCRETFYSILCTNCGAYLRALLDKVQGHDVPVVGEPLQEGFHYVMRGSNMVFTETYHMMRGHCCRSGCKHCVYGFKAPHAR